MAAALFLEAAVDLAGDWRIECGLRDDADADNAEGPYTARALRADSLPVAEAEEEAETDTEEPLRTPGSGSGSGSRPQVDDDGSSCTWIPICAVWTAGVGAGAGGRDDALGLREGFQLKFVCEAHTNLCVDSILRPTTPID